jgi:hypothetical protein
MTTCLLPPSLLNNETHGLHDFPATVGQQNLSCKGSINITGQYTLV